MKLNDLIKNPVPHDYAPLNELQMMQLATDSIQTKLCLAYEVGYKSAVERVEQLIKEEGDLLELVTRQTDTLAKQNNMLEDQMTILEDQNDLIESLLKDNHRLTTRSLWQRIFNL